MIRNDRYICDVEIDDDFTGKWWKITVIDSKTNTIIDTRRVRRAPISGGWSTPRTEMEELCKKLNEENWYLTIWMKLWNH